MTDADLIAQYLARDGSKVKRIPQGERATRFTNREFYMMTRDDYRAREVYKNAPLATLEEREIAAANGGLLPA